jgi:hypothetical protein
MHLARLHGGLADFRSPNAAGAVADDFYYQHRMYRRPLVSDVPVPMPPPLQPSSSCADNDVNISADVSRGLDLLGCRPMDSILARGGKSPPTKMIDGCRLHQQETGRSDVIGEPLQAIAFFVEPVNESLLCSRFTVYTGR